MCFGSKSPHNSKASYISHNLHPHCVLFIFTTFLFRCRRLPLLLHSLSLPLYSSPPTQITMALKR